MRQVLTGLLPSLGLAAAFWYAMRSVIRADRHERAAQARLDAKEMPE